MNTTITVREETSMRLTVLTYNTLFAAETVPTTAARDFRLIS